MIRVAGFFALIGLYSCSIDEHNQGEIILTGKVKFPGNGYVYLELQTPDGFEKIDSSRLSDDQTFSLAVDQGSEDIYRVDIFGKQQVSLVIGDDDLQIQADGNSPIGTFSGTGSPEIEVISRANQLALHHKISTELIRQRIRTAQNNSDSVSFFKWNDSLHSINRNFKTNLKDIIRKEAGSLTALMLIMEHFDIEANLEFYDEQMDFFRARLEDHWQMDFLNKAYLSIKKLAVGAIAPDFTLPDPEGNLINLSSFRGKYVFIDFWASWCQPCRLENPNLVKVYNKFRGRQFEIVGVSFDRKKENWLKAIEKDGLDWVHASDLKYFDSEMIRLYNIVNVPMSFLLDPEGKIIAKNISSDQLDEILGEVL